MKRPIVTLLIIGLVISTGYILVKLLPKHTANQPVNGVVNCGTAQYFTSLDSKESQGTETHKAEGCFRNAFNTCQLAVMQTKTGDWEGGVTKSTHTIIPLANNSCAIKVVSETDAFYVYFGHKKTQRTCRNVTISKGTFAVNDCTKPEEIYDYCENPELNEKYLDQCLLKRALDEQDSNICHQISFEWGRNYCTSQIK